VLKESDVTGSAAGILNESRVDESTCIHFQAYNGTTTDDRIIEDKYISVL
jgi:hypothetical protein